MNTFIRIIFIPILLVIALPFISNANVNLIKYQVFLKDNAVVYVDWVTDGEVDNDHFILERSSNGISFSPYAIVQGNGTTTMRQHYRVIDQNPTSNTTYYRLIQIDAGGQHDTISVVNVTKQVNLSNYDFVLAPNPVSNGGTLKVNGYGKSYHNQPVKVYNLASGQLVYEAVITPEVTEFNLPDHLSRGTYIIKTVNADNQIIAQPFMVK